MATVREQIQSADEAICGNIELLAEQRALLSQNILSQLRNLVEGVSVLLYKGSPDTEFNYSSIGLAIAFVKSNARISFLGKFHKLIEMSASHYTLDGDASERLMLKYYEYLHRIRSLLRDNFGFAVLENLETFPVDLDPSLREYHEKIAARIEAVRSSRPDSNLRDRYYIHNTRPFFVNERIYYEVTFFLAVNNVSKFGRIIAFTDIDIKGKYAVMLTLQRDSIEVLGQTMPITIIRKWEISIRPCEFNNFARLLGLAVSVRTDSIEYRNLMRWLTLNSSSLIDLVEMPDNKYSQEKMTCTREGTETQIFSVLDEVRSILRAAAPGHNVLRFLMLRFYNRHLKLQYSDSGCAYLSNLKLKYGCIPFDTMPFCSSLLGHNPRCWDLLECLDATGRNHELLARRVRNNVDRLGMLYTPVADLEDFGDANVLISKYNSNLYYKHFERQLSLDKGHVFIRGYENDTVSIVKKLQQCSLSGIAGYTQALERWLGEKPRGIDDPAKEDILKRLFSHSRVVLIYGAAGTGKSTMVNHIAQYFNDRKKLFLAHTHPAIDNLLRKVTAQNSSFRTINSQIYNNNCDSEYDLLIIDECSTVSNANLIQVLNQTHFKLLILVGDVCQIESIQFGNWFETIRSFMPNQAVFELMKPYRTTNASLLKFWKSVRDVDDDIAEIMARNGYSSMLNESLFETRVHDEIILCLNYDGLYGINNINRFLQSSNPGVSATWRESTYKVGDPVLFHETERFRPVIYNNLRGRIVGIDQGIGFIQFDVELDRPLSEFDNVGDELKWVEGSTVRFSVYECDTSDDDDSLNTTVPFQVAYAVSIHKSQGLEYNSVKIVVTDANEDDITHSVFYTAVTRARERLRIFWTPETQQRVIQRLHRNTNPKDIFLLASRRGLIPVNK